MTDSKVTVRKFAYAGTLEETVEVFGKGNMLADLTTGDIVVINAFREPTWYEISETRDLVKVSK